MNSPALNVVCELHILLVYCHTLVSVGCLWYAPGSELIDMTAGLPDQPPENHLEQRGLLKGQ